MARNDSSDQEFDQDMERALQEHFDVEESNLRADSDPWEWLQTRLDEPPVPPFLSRWLNWLQPVREGRLSPAFALVGVVVVTVAVAATLWALSGNGNSDSPEGLVVVQEMEAPASPPFSTAASALTLVKESTVARQESDETVPSAQGPAGSAGADGAQGPAGPASLQGPEATAAPAAAMMEEPAAPAASAGTDGVQGPEGTTAPTEMMKESAQIAAPAATMAPAATLAVSRTATPAPQPTAAAQAMAAEPQAEAEGAMTSIQAMEAAGPAGADAAQARPASGSSGSPPDATFRDYQRQPFVAASDDNVSTFSLDTDRTSYHLALNWARSGYEVDPDSVRAEEWLNAFDYQYAPPSDDFSFAITSDLYPHPLDEKKRLARIAFQAPELVDERPLNVTLVLDASGSMAEGNRVDIAREAAESIRRSLRPNDRIAVVHFTNDVIPSFTVDHTHPNDARVSSSIAWLAPHASTNVQAGLNLGVSMADHTRDLRPDSYNYVILMSDGVANVDATDPFAILETAYDTETLNPLRLITIGVGINNYNDPLLEQLAQHGNGWYRYLNNTNQARATFSRNNWMALSIPFADQTRAQVTWDPEVVERWRIVGYENRVTPDHTFTQDRREFAELYSGAATTVLYEVELTDPARAQSVVQLGGVELRWVDPDTGESSSQTATLSGDLNAGFRGRAGTLAKFGAIVALSADLYGALPKASESTYPEVYTKLSESLEQLRSLHNDLGGLEAYSDFDFLLEYITGDTSRQVPTSTRSGYSR